MYICMDVVMYVIMFVVKCMYVCACVCICVWASHPVQCVRREYLSLLEIHADLQQQLSEEVPTRFYTLSLHSGYRLTPLIRVWIYECVCWLHVHGHMHA